MMGDSNKIIKPTWQDTSAGRLHAIFERAKAQPSNHSSRNCWAKVFEIKPENTRILLRHLADVSQLFLTVQRELISLDDDIDFDHLAERFDRIATCLAETNFGAPFEHVLQHLDATTMYSLKSCAVELARHGLAARIEAEELTSLRADVRRIIDSIIASDLDKNFKTFLLKYLKLIEDALIDYAITGCEGVAEALERALGAVLANPEIKEQIVKSGIGAEWWGVVVKTGKVLSTAMAFGKAAAWVYKIFAEPGVDDPQRLLPPT